VKTRFVILKIFLDRQRSRVFPMRTGRNKNGRNGTARAGDEGPSTSPSL
jgi:hypothetical protein